MLEFGRMLSDEELLQVSGGTGTETEPGYAIGQVFTLVQQQIDVTIVDIVYENGVLLYRLEGKNFQGGPVIGWLKEQTIRDELASGGLLMK